MSRRRAFLASVFIGATLIVPARLNAAPAAQPGDRARLRDYFTQEDIDRSRRYRTPAYLLSFSSLGVEIAVLLLIGLAAGTHKLRSLAERAGGDRWWLQAIVLAAIVTLVLAIARLSFSAGREALDKSWGLSTRSPAGFGADLAKGLMFQLVLTILVAVGFFAITRTLPRSWPFVAGAGAVVLTVALSMLWPLVYEPLFNKFTPVEPALRERIVALGEKSGVNVGAVYVADASKRTTRLNAYVSGLGSTKRVVLYDTLLEKTTPEEVDLVVAHELAHVAHNDVVKGTALGALGAAGVIALIWLLLRSPSITGYLGVRGPGDPGVLPFLVMVVILAGILVLPLGSWYSRRIEASADRTAIRVTRDWETAIRVERSLARLNLADLQPNPAIRFVFFSHPSVMERIQIALEERDRLR